MTAASKSSASESMLTTSVQPEQANKKRAEGEKPKGP